MIRIAVLDRHPAVRAGVEATITLQHGLASVGAARDIALPASGEAA